MKAELAWKRSEFNGGAWERVALSSLYSVKYGKANPSRPGNVPVVGSSGVYAWTANPLILHPTVVIGRKGSAGQAWLVEVPSYPSDTTFYLEPHDPTHTDIRFTYFALRYFQISASDDVIPSLQRHELENLVLPFPPLPEQRAIAAVLSKIQAAVEVQDKIVATLRELKAATMAKLFREGLRGEPLKQTEIGEVPESWEVALCETLCETISVGIVVTPAKYYTSTGVPCFRSFNVQEDRLLEKDLVFISEAANELHGKSKLRVGDVIIVRTGYPGTACVVPEKYDGANCIDLLFARPNQQLVQSDYLARYINSSAGKKQVLFAQGGLAQQHFNVGALKRMLVALPSKEEQAAISRIGCLLDGRILTAEAELSSLRALLSSMLHLLMTGQVRVNQLVTYKHILSHMKRTKG